MTAPRNSFARGIRLQSLPTDLPQPINIETKQNYITLPTKVHLVKAMVFTVVMYGYESWTIKKAECQRIDAFELWVLEKTLESPLDCKEIQPVHPKGDQSWIFIERTDAEAETPILWPPDVKKWLIGKDSDAGKDWRQEEKGTMENKMVGWHHRLDGPEFEQAPGVGDGQGSLVCCSPWGHKELDMTEWLNWSNTNVYAKQMKLQDKFHRPFSNWFAGPWLSCSEITGATSVNLKSLSQSVTRTQPPSPYTCKHLSVFSAF